MLLDGAGYRKLATTHFTAVMLTNFFQVLAVDLLNPSPAAEAKKHKLKV
jgi:hypothetical protein